MNIENKLVIFQNTVHHISAFETGNAAVSPISQLKKLKIGVWMNWGELLLKMNKVLGFRGSKEH